MKLLIMFLAVLLQVQGLPAQTRNRAPAPRPSHSYHYQGRSGYYYPYYYPMYWGYYGGIVVIRVETPGEKLEREVQKLRLSIFKEQAKAVPNKEKIEKMNKKLTLKVFECRLLGVGGCGPY